MNVARRRQSSRAGEVATVYFSTVGLAVIIASMVPGGLFMAVIMGFWTLVGGFLFGFFLVLPVLLAVLRKFLSGWRFGVAAMIGAQSLYFGLWYFHPLLRLNRDVGEFFGEYTMHKNQYGKPVMGDALLYTLSLLGGLLIATILLKPASEVEAGQAPRPANQ